MSTRDWVEKDYYKTLGVPKDAKPDQIKKAFRKIARENHPDQHPGDKSAEQRFKEASEAHDVLSDPDKRREPFRRMRQLFDDLRAQGLEMDTLSMGMTDDMAAGIAEGATMVRVGTAIFGERDKKDR